MDYYGTMRTDQIHRERYGQSPMNVDWVPKGEPKSPMVNIRKKERCSPRFVSKIEGNAVEEGCKVFFEGIVDAQPFPSFTWYFNDQPIVPGKDGFEEAEIHDSRKMSTLIITYAQEWHMGKYSLVTSNQLGSAECCCDLIVRKKQFPPVFWKRLYNVVGEDSNRFVGEVEVGGWPVPAVFWYKVLEDGTEVEVETRTHTENWNGNPNKYVPSSRVELKQIDQIRHSIIFQQASDGDSGLYRVRAVNCLGEAECEAELSFDGCGGGMDLYLPPNWQDKKRLTWKDEDQRKKPFEGQEDDDSLSPEDLANMRKKAGGVPLSRITEYLASLPDYSPTDKFRNIQQIPFTPGVDDKHNITGRRGGKLDCWPSKFKLGQITHRGYVTDNSGRVLPLWYNKSDPRGRDSSDWTWKSVYPNLFIPDVPRRSRSPTPTPTWETDNDIRQLIAWLRSLGNHNEEDNKQNNKGVDKINENNYQPNAQHPKGKAKESNTRIESEHEANCRKMWAETLERNVVGAQTNANQFTGEFMRTIKTQNNNVETCPPALPMKSKIKIKNSNTTVITEAESRTRSEGEFVPVREKIKQITEQQDEISRKEEDKTSELENVKHAGVRVLPASPIPVRKISGQEKHEQEAYVKESIHTNFEEGFVPVREKIKQITEQQEEISRKEEDKTSELENVKHAGVRVLPASPITVRKMSGQEKHEQEAYVKEDTHTNLMMENRSCFANETKTSLEDMSLINVNEASMSYQETTSQYKTELTQSFFVQKEFHQQVENCQQLNIEERFDANSSIDNTNNNQNTNFAIEEFSNKMSVQQPVLPQKSKSSAKIVPTNTAQNGPTSAPTTPLNRRRASYRQNESEIKHTGAQYKEGPSSPFQPGFYRKPPVDSSKPVFTFVKRNNSRTNIFCEK